MIRPEKKIGIISYGAYIPLYRLERRRITEAWGNTGGTGERSVANYDEDSLTMAVEAAFDCLVDFKGKLDAVIFASTTPPYREKQAASILSSVLDLGEDTRTFDMGNSLRSGTSSIIFAKNFVAANPGAKVLVVTSDLRIPAPNSELELLVGDGAAAFLVGDTDLAATIICDHSISSAFLDTWRRDDERYYRTWENRFTIEKGFFDVMARGVSGLMNTHKLGPGDFAKVVIYAPDSRRHDEMARKLGFDSKIQLQDSRLNIVGNTGSAFVPMMLVSALEEAKAGDRLLAAGYGDGCDVLVLSIEESPTKSQARQSIRHQVESKEMLKSYGRYLRWRQMIDYGPSLIPPIPSYLPVYWRDHKQALAFYGHKCKHCGTVQYPMQRICTQCQTKDEFDEIKLPKKGTLFTFSTDERAPVADPPNVPCVVDIEGGGRFPCSMTDRGSREISAGMPVELTFRNIHTGSGFNNYFWKCRPIRV